VRFWQNGPKSNNANEFGGNKNKKKGCKGRGREVIYTFPRPPSPTKLPKKLIWKN